MTARGSWSRFEKCMSELSPYVKERLEKSVSMKMPEIERLMARFYNDYVNFRKFVDEVFGKDFGKIVPNDERIAEKILDLDFWFIIQYTLQDFKEVKRPIRIDRKFTGRLTEIVVESVLKSSLNAGKLDYVFVDYDPVDYVILKGNEVICEISCKTVLSGKSKNFFNYMSHAEAVAKRLEGQNRSFVVFCACADEEEKECIRRRFESINKCRLFYLWCKTGRWMYLLDDSFYEFVRFIKKLNF